MFRTTNENAEKVLRGEANLLCAQRGPRGQDSRPCRFAARCDLRKNESDGETTQPASGTLGSLRSARPQISKPLPNHRMAKAFLPVPRKSVHGRALSDTNWRPSVRAGATPPEEPNEARDSPANAFVPSCRPS